MDNNKDSFSKPTYDGRLHYYNQLSKWVEAISLSCNNEDYYNWFMNLRGYYVLIKPFIRTKDITDVDKKIKKIHNKLIILSSTQQNLSLSSKLGLSKDLFDLNENLYKYSRHLLLPITDEEESDYDEDGFMRGSDL